MNFANPTERITLRLLCGAFVLLLTSACGSDRAGEPAKTTKAVQPAAAKEDDHKEDLLKLSDEEASRAGLKTEALEERQASDSLTVTGTIEADRERLAHVMPPIPGRIVSVAARLGDAVKQGQALAVLESIELGEAYSANAQAQAEARVAGKALERAERLHAEQIIPGKEHQKAQGEAEKARAQAQASSDKLKMLGVSPSESGKGMGSRLPINAPLSGSVIERKAVLGELARTDAPLFIIADLSTVWLEANIAEAQLGGVRAGASARARLSAYPDQVFEGKVGHVMAVLDKETRTAKAIITLDNRAGLLKPAMFANVSIESGKARKVLSVPETAVTLVQGLPNVFVEAAGGFEARPVELGDRSDGRITIKSGVKAGELVVVEGVYALKARVLKSQISSGHGH